MKEDAVIRSLSDEIHQNVILKIRGSCNFYSKMALLSGTVFIFIFNTGGVLKCPN